MARWQCCTAILLPVRPTPHMLLRGLLKFLAVAVAAGVVGAGLGIGLAELGGGDDDGTPFAPRTTSTASLLTTTPPAQTTTSTTSPPTTSPTSPPTTTTPTPTTSIPAETTTTSTTATDGQVSRTTRVQIQSAVLYPASTPRGRARRRARVVVRVRLTNRSADTLRAPAPMLIVGAGRVRADPRAAEVAGPLLRSLAPAKSARGELRFETIGSITQLLMNQPRARLSIAGRTVSVSIRVSSTPAPAG